MAVERSDDQLRVVSEHLLYEVQMLSRTAAELERGGFWERVQAALQGDRQQSVRFALIESWALHARNLLGFFYPTAGRHSEDAAADEFFQRGQWEQLRPEDDDSERSQLRDRIAQDVLHLTHHRSRREPELKPWDVTAVVRDFVAPALSAFIKHVPDERVIGGFKRQAAEGLTVPGTGTVATGPLQPRD